jgi:hypothetical protein
MENSEPDMPRRVEAIYKDAVENIRFVKRQQWVITNYSILILAAIYALAPNVCGAKALLTVLAVVAVV